MNASPGYHTTRRRFDHPLLATGTTQGLADTTSDRHAGIHAIAGLGYDSGMQISLIIAGGLLGITMIASIYL